MTPVPSLAAALAWVGSASACPYDTIATTTRASSNGAVAMSVDAAVAAHCARSRALVGSNCSYTTGMIARRVVEEGVDWELVGTLSAAPNTLASLVAAPFVAPDGAYVVANELIELMAAGGHAAGRLSLVGKVLDIDGVRYVVVTSFVVVTS
jgi:hypothetical protein